MSGAAATPRGAEVAALAACAARHAAVSRRELVARLRAAEAPDPESLLDRLLQRRWLADRGEGLELAAAGALALLDAWGRIEDALAINPEASDAQECPSLPWLVAVETEWIEALSFNYRLAPDVLAARLPAPLQPEVFKGHGWVQVLVSSLREMRPRGLPGPAGVSFYQVSYRAAVRYRSADGGWRRGGYFLRSETNDALMRAIGNRLAEFRFHEFGAADILMVRDGDRLTVGIDSETAGGKLIAVVDTRPRAAPPPGSVWGSLDELHEPLVDCCDAFGVDDDAGYLYTLTIERGRWNPRFVEPVDLFCEAFAEGGDWPGAVLDSVLHIPRCPYRWLPLRREVLASLPTD